METFPFSHMNWQWYEEVFAFLKMSVLIGAIPLCASFKMSEGDYILFYDFGSVFLGFFLQVNR